MAAWYRNGTDVPQDLGKSNKLVEKGLPLTRSSCEEGHQKACIALLVGHMKDGVLGEDQEKATAFRDLWVSHSLNKSFQCIGK
jgi:hypothetical protein